jgi:hypothetical protein
VGDGNVGYGDASWQGQEDVPAGFDPEAGTRGRGASTPGKARRWRVASLVEAIPALCTTRRKIPFRMSWRNVVCAVRVGHGIFSHTPLKGS